MIKRFLIACGLALALPAGAASVIPLYLDEIVDRSAVAFEGTCVENRVERDAQTNMVVTYTTFSVRDVLKGKAEGNYVIKQVGGTLPDDTFHYEVNGVPKFTPGEDYVVFLAGVSSAGFSSPLGLEQGKFPIRSAAAGLRVGNGIDFRDMTGNIRGANVPAVVQQMQAATSPVRDLDLDEFKQLVRQRIGRTQ